MSERRKEIEKGDAFASELTDLIVKHARDGLTPGDLYSISIAALYRFAPSDNWAENFAFVMQQVTMTLAALMQRDAAEKSDSAVRDAREAIQRARD